MCFYLFIVCPYTFHHLFIYFFINFQYHDDVIKRARRSESRVYKDNILKAYPKQFITCIRDASGLLMCVLCTLDNSHRLHRGKITLMNITIKCILAYYFSALYVVGMGIRQGSLQYVGGKDRCMWCCFVSEQLHHYQHGRNEQIAGPLQFFQFEKGLAVFH